MLKSKQSRKKPSKNAPKARKSFPKLSELDTRVELQRLKTFLSVKAVDFVLPLTGQLQNKLNQLQQKLNKA